MRTATLIIAAASLLFLKAPDAAFAGNEEDCREWCGAHTECDRCSARLGCGVGYRTIRRFTGPGKNWYACEGRGDAGEAASRENQSRCASWCSDHPECEKCSDILGCGPGFRTIESFTGRGTNWYACAPSRRSEGSENNESACRSWCGDHPECDRCSELIGCGPGYRRIRSFNGPGKNWYACAGQGGDREEASRNNQQQCEAWCSEHSECVRCSELIGCGRGQRRIRSFTGPGKNWYACEER
jgi:hypothetical protein